MRRTSNSRRIVIFRNLNSIIYYSLKSENALFDYIFFEIRVSKFE